VMRVIRLKNCTSFVHSLMHSLMHPLMHSLIALPCALPCALSYALPFAFQGGFALKGGNAQEGNLQKLYEGARPAGYETMKKQGAIILGIGGDAR
jgi:hypothetical protein